MKTWKSENQLSKEWSQMKRWIKWTVNQSGLNKVILGLSGGFDSGFLAFTASQEDCLGKDGVIAVLMPCDSSKDSVEDAIDLAKALGITFFVDNIRRAVDVRVSEMDVTRENANQLIFGTNFEKVTKMNPTEIGNVKARMRMITLYGYAPAFGALVMNTSNYSEAISGNGTKYGDITGDFSPLLRYTKTTLYRMAKAVGFDKFSSATFNKIPTADLEPGQTDEGTMGVQYVKLDAFIEGVEVDDDGKYIEIDKAALNRIYLLESKSWHKRNPMPVFKPTM
jgi:NAD+ synthetase